MTSKEILSRAAGLIDRSGLARKMAYDSKTGAFCFGSSLVEAATYNKKFHEKEYMLARNALCGSLGLASSYDALVGYNDDSFVTKKGELIYRHSSTEIVTAIRAVINQLGESV